MKACSGESGVGGEIVTLGASLRDGSLMEVGDRFPVPD